MRAPRCWLDSALRTDTDHLVGNAGLMTTVGKLFSIPNASTDGEIYALTPVSPTKVVLADFNIVAEQLPTAAGQPREYRVTGDGPKPSSCDR